MLHLTWTPSFNDLVATHFTDTPQPLQLTDYLVKRYSAQHVTRPPALEVVLLLLLLLLLFMLEHLNFVQPGSSTRKKLLNEARDTKDWFRPRLKLPKTSLWQKHSSFQWALFLSIPHSNIVTRCNIHPHLIGIHDGYTNGRHNLVLTCESHSNMTIYISKGPWVES
jgi:hypothetical protein